jgi:hypothetical protein
MTSVLRLGKLENTLQIRSLCASSNTVYCISNSRTSNPGPVVEQSVCKDVLSFTHIINH